MQIGIKFPLFWNNLCQGRIIEMIYLYLLHYDARKLSYMKKTILSFLSIVALALGASAQGLNIYVEGTAVDISGSEHVINLTEETSLGLGNNDMVDFMVDNDAGTQQSWIVTREIVSAPAGWQDYFCWGQDGLAGICYPPNSNQFYESNAESIAAGASGRITVYVNSNSGGSATYRFFVSTDGVNFIDSVDLKVNSVLSVDEKAPFSLQLTPNPASSDLKITTNTNSLVRITDVLGNIVYRDEVLGTKVVNVAKFKNGIYFVSVEANGEKPVTRKVIVKH